MDNLEKNLTYTVNKFGKSWTFRRPTARQLVQADVLAAQMRQQLPLSSLLYAGGLSDMVASLNTFVIEPKGFDFGDLYDDQVIEIYNEVSKWMDSFRHKMES